MIKKWMTKVQDGDKEVILYTATSDDSIKIDLEAGQAGSFILQNRDWNRRQNPTEDTDHIDLASGALSHHRNLKGYKHANLAIMPVDEIPSGLEPHPLGGHSKNGYTQYAVSVYEERK